ncbi:aldehyde dehydrogenase family protein [Brevibacterium sp. BDJS002]|uniref:Aldehyde dehydrogenase family protein n=1 Tax=Brevibacterium aurantiacum TaxID=273384 RepID=A0A2A3ZG33_BREAU|nr:MULTISPECIES: aldehyde dehydrogenase family protein [Brevibacterium]MDN5551933.1 aldehyde dehydrogenase family protein [Brevibacterium sp.]PCC50528.1 aldehyde dehydrogenase family protein [Brevibacterium aurantiacum]WCE41139.1 aldehyde dehydrogenase family protein [Brevibacterium sp. BDJS002]SMX99729.1 delta-1-piperideine-6-carboxylate dehydrogenase [Brevibacterium aurantiacum]
MTALPTDQTITDLLTGGLKACGVDTSVLTAGSSAAASLPARSPITGQSLGTLAADTKESASEKIGAAAEAFAAWRDVPAPVRGQLVQRWGQLLGEHKEDLAKIITVEAGKTPSEAAGEVQEMIDICEFALGQSRQLWGKTMPSERPGHRLMETWHPLGVVGVISAFNFPVAVYSWNTALALVAGDAVVWKPSENAVLAALGAQSLLARAAAEVGAPEGLVPVLVGGRDIGDAMVRDERVALVSATGSVRMGREVGPVVAERFGRVLLELGGNNGAIVAPSADIDLALRGVVFAAAGTAGQRCTTLRRLIVHESIADDFVDKIVAAYKTLSIGSPTEDGVLVGPLINEGSYEAMQAALKQAESEGGTVLTGGARVLDDERPDAHYVEPAVVRMPTQTSVMESETFAPILYVVTYSDLDEALEIHNGVPQGLSSAIFTSELAESEKFLSRSDCGIANVNIGTSGAEIGGAFGGEKETGGGRESGTDSWKAYMRQATNTVNYSGELPLAQGVEFL